MQFAMTMNAGKIQNQEALDVFKSLEGEYIVDVLPRYPKSLADNHALYRVKLKNIANHIGEQDANVVHQQFKKDNSLGSTADLSLNEWIHIHDLFQRWVYLNLDFIL